MASGNQSGSTRLSVPTVTTPPSSTQSIRDANPVRVYQVNVTHKGEREGYRYFAQRSLLRTPQTHPLSTPLKWTGDKNNPFRFQVVGELGSEPGFLAEHDGRIAVSGWTGVMPNEAIGEMPAVYLSPPIPMDGLDLMLGGNAARIYGLA